MPIVDDVEEHIGGIGAVGEIAHFVDDQDARLDVGRERLGEAAARNAAERSSISSAAVTKAHRKPF
jgi:hypothetical protein